MLALPIYLNWLQMHSLGQNNTPVNFLRFFRLATTWKVNCTLDTQVSTSTCTRMLLFRGLDTRPELTIVQAVRNNQKLDYTTLLHYTNSHTAKKYHSTRRNISLLTFAPASSSTRSTKQTNKQQNLHETQDILTFALMSGKTPRAPIEGVKRNKRYYEKQTSRRNGYWTTIA